MPMGQCLSRPGFGNAGNIGGGNVGSPVNVYPPVPSPIPGYRGVISEPGRHPGPSTSRSDQPGPSTSNTNTGQTNEEQEDPMHPPAVEQQPHVREPECETPDQPMNFSKGALIGQGAFGTVFAGLKDTGEIIAVKQVTLTREERLRGRVTEHIKALEDEVRVLRTLRHMNIVQYLGTSRTEDTLNIFLEYVSGGSIASLIERFGKLQESVVRVYTKQILRGLEYLHKQKIMHRDIKGANILVDGHGTVKLADFGASKKIEDIATLGSGAQSIRGTPYWMAPEVIKQTGHGRPADIWSLGCVVIEMASGRPPWSNCHTQVSAMFHIATSSAPPEFPEHLSSEAKDFLKLCFNRVPKERPTAGRLLKHPWMLATQIPGDASRSAPSLPVVTPVSRAPPSPVQEVPGEPRVNRPPEGSRPPLPKPVEPAVNTPITPPPEPGMKVPGFGLPPPVLGHSQASPRPTSKPSTSHDPDFNPMLKGITNYRQSQTLKSFMQEKTQRMGNVAESSDALIMVATVQRPATASAALSRSPEPPQQHISSERASPESVEAQVPSEQPAPEEEESSENTQPCLPVISEDAECANDDQVIKQLEPSAPPVGPSAEPAVRSSMLTLDFNPMMEPSWMGGGLLEAETQNEAVKHAHADKEDDQSATSPLEVQESEPLDVKQSAARVLVLEESLAGQCLLSQDSASKAVMGDEYEGDKKGEVQKDDPLRSSKVQKWEAELMADLEKQREQQRAQRASLATASGLS